MFLYYKYKNDLIKYTIFIIYFMENKCNNCFKKANKICSQCKLVNYCSKECQKNDWKVHKHKCIKRRPIDDIWELCKWNTPQNSKLKNKCVLCSNTNVIENLTSELEIKEYQISGMCSHCQNKVFNDETEY